jgi:hypothetical protein
VSIAVGGTASFFAGASALGDVTYQWLRDGGVMKGETGPRLTFSGSATDAEDGAIPGTDLSWAIRLNHDDHDHALINNFIGADGSFTVPPAIESSTNVWVTLYLTATDSEGTSTTITQRVDPKIVTLTLASNPGGLQVQLDGGTQPAPLMFDSVVGVDREIGAPPQQALNGVNYTFDSWSDGLGRNEIRSTPNNDATWTAAYSGGPVGKTCTATEVAGGVRIGWTNKGGTEVLRNSGGWVATPAAGTLIFTQQGGLIDDGWLIRRRGVDETCSTGGPPPPPTVCTVAALGAGGVRISWQNTAGTEVIRNGGGWVTTPPAGQLIHDSPGGTLNDG